MFGLFDSLFSNTKRLTQADSAAQPRRLEFQPLESRDLMATIPALSSLPNAPKTLYLDFDGDTQLVWNRTDETPQIYRNVRAGEFNIDGTAGISDAEAAAIRKIWETVADDYAPFNINVTTVAPSSFANGTALRVVMAGDCTANLVTGRNTTLAVSGDRFISDGAGGLVDTSGYSSVGSFSDAEPNVVYVFAKYMSTWNMVDSEGHSRDLRAIIATTASHEAGHSFGLVHHGDYDVGSAITTPIMGSNTQGDRTIWSKYTVDGVVHDNLAELTTKLGARPDDFGSSYESARELQFTSSTIFGFRASVAGIIGTGSDVDMFKLTVGSTKIYNLNITVPQFGDLDSQLVVYKVTKIPLFGYYYQNIATVDPSISSIQPFQGLGASIAINLPPGTYAIAVKSHGTFGDLGNYTLSVSHSSILIDPVITQAVAGTSLSSSSTSPGVVPTTTNVSAIANPPRFGSAGAGASTASPLTTKPKLSTAAVDAIFSDWASDGPKLQRHLLPAR